MKLLIFVSFKKYTIKIYFMNNLMELISYCRWLCFFINLFKLEKFDLEKKAK
jgi:hypothetical protein